VSTRPTLLHGCAAAATAAEARFRIDAPVDVKRAARVIALDAGAAEATAEVARLSWQGAVFLTCEVASGVSPNGHGQDPVLRAMDGSEQRLSEVLAGADVAVMVATDDDGAGLAAAIGEACWERRIMTAGLVIDIDRRLGAAVRALRPHAQVLLVSRDADDVAEVLSALRA
jgi:hypothetical protein